MADKSIGVKGYGYVINMVMGPYHNYLNPDCDCPAFKFIKKSFVEKSSSGNWPQWTFITILRYISQIKKSTNI